MRNKQTSKKLQRKLKKKIGKLQKRTRNLKKKIRKLRKSLRDFAWLLPEQQTQSFQRMKTSKACENTGYIFNLEGIKNAIREDRLNGQKPSSGMKIY